jgi:Ser/Thr protein kinase RdoA (MazF antagonist)
MPLFDQTIAVSAEEIAEIVAENWNLKLGPIIKASQNHTFQATNEDADGVIIKYVVRVTPNPQEHAHVRIKNEVFFVNYLAESKKLQHICAPVKSLSGEFVVRSGDSSVTVSEWAKGSAMDFLSYRWMTDKNIVFAWGKWLAEFHQISQQFSVEHPEIAQSIQRWDQVHSNILEGAEIHSADQEVVTNPKHYGVLHGDLNLSNFFFDDETQSLSVFDWDQAQQGWYLMDLAQAELTVYMLNEGGSLVDGELLSFCFVFYAERSICLFCCFCCWHLRVNSLLHSLAPVHCLYCEFTFSTSNRF